jgi:hypothetical protein
VIRWQRCIGVAALAAHEFEAVLTSVLKALMSIVSGFSLCPTYPGTNQCGKFWLAVLTIATAQPSSSSF